MSANSSSTSISHKNKTCKYGNGCYRRCSTHRKKYHTYDSDQYSDKDDVRYYKTFRILSCKSCCEKKKHQLIYFIKGDLIGNYSQGNDNISISYKLIKVGTDYKIKFIQIMFKKEYY